MQTICNLNNFSILFEDDYLVAIHKPAGLLVHRSPIDRHETQFAVQLTRDAVGKKVFPIHRLDKPTSGLLLFALDSETASKLGQQFMQHSIQKIYQAICRGWSETEDQIDHALKYKKDKIADKLKKDSDIPQEAITNYKTLATTTVQHTIGKFEQQRYSLVELYPQTGRKHQLRRHLNHISHPIIGDVKYGDRHHNHFFFDWLQQHRLYLAATKLKFTHPQTGQPIELSAPLEDSFKLALDKLNF
jgi:tRNA pseudouridine65 synthase